MYKQAELQQIARNNNIDVKFRNAPVMKPGWEGQPKGLLQVLWERGFIEEESHEDYHVHPKKDENGEVIEDSENSSLYFLMSTCLDFSKETTALEGVGEELGVKVYITPKFHCEIAGEGIEYAWGVAKGVYRRKPLKEKKGKKSDFQKLVKECVSREILTTECVRKLSRRARAYICAYYQIESKKNGATAQVDKMTSLPEIEALMKEFRTHRSALDFDSAFCKSVVRRINE